MPGLEGLLALLRRYAADHSHAVLPMPADVDPQAILPEYSLDTVQRTLVQRGMARVVDVEGAVVSPGVVTLTEGSRVYEAVEAAGGMAESADHGKVNLAEKVSDGM